MNTFHKTKGFSLIETIVAIVVLTLAVVGPMTLSAQSIRASRDARLELTATHLAEEGMEVVHNIRDNNSAQDADPARGAWMTNILPICSTGCVVDVTEHSTGVWGPTALISCAGNCSTVDRIYQHSTTGLYRQFSSALASPWTVTPFRRSVTVTEVVANRQVRVTSSVSYRSYGGSPRTISTSQDFYNWFPRLN